MTAKRFNSYCDNENIRIRIDDDIKNKEVFHIYFAELDDALYCKSKLNPILDLLNQLSDENEQLKSRIEHLKRKIQRERASEMKQHEKWENEIQKENKQLKSDKEALIDFIKMKFPKSHKHILEGFE